MGALGPSVGAWLLVRIGLNGMISDQTQRAFFPSGLPMMVMARKLWRSDVSYEEIARDYYTSAFGPDGVLCRDYLDQISESFNPAWLTRFSPKKGTILCPRTRPADSAVFGPSSSSFAR